MSAQRVVVIGSSAAGHFTTLALDRQGIPVTLIEQEVLAPCDNPAEAFERWERRGAPQTRHSHAFLARLHNGIRDHWPRLYQELMEAGAEALCFSDIIKNVFPNEEMIPEDQDLTLLACRRITFDWVLRRHVDRETSAIRRDGVQVVGLIAETDHETKLKRVTGVRVKNEIGEEESIAADLVVDASGRNSHLRRWLEKIDAGKLEQDSESCGIFYCSRFYRIHDGVEPPPIEGPIAGDLGYLKFASFQGDSGIFSITLAASPEDRDLRQLRHPQVFQAVAKSLKATSPWVDASVSEPITDVYHYANLKNTRRYFVRNNLPIALGIFPIGDALIHINPLAGRGCTLSFIAATLLAEHFSALSHDLLEFARKLDGAIGREIVPWYQNMLEQDRAAKESARIEGQKEGEDPLERDDGSIDPRAYMRSLFRDGFIPALREDIGVLRAFMRIFNMLDSPTDLLRQPELLPRVLAVWQKRGERERVSLGPSQKELVSQILSALD